MFKFDFEVEELDEEISAIAFSSAETPKKKEDPVEEQPFTEIQIQHLIDCLPPFISCSPLSIPLSSGQSITLSRRDLFDARFQLMNEEDNEKSPGEDAMDFLDAPSDLVHGVYEGGLKTWECSLDLVDYIHEKSTLIPNGKRVLEVGCGTAVPSVFFLNKILSGPPSDETTEIHLQDYNASVFELITFPNLVLAWYMSPASKNFRETSSVLEDPESELPAADPTVVADIPMSPALKAAFLASLKDHSVVLRFFSGSWRTFKIERPYEIILTSETIYRSESMTSLISLLHSACGSQATCLVAAKVLYFGVGGGVTAFVNAVEETSGKAETVWEKTSGVGRKILSVQW